MPVRIRTTLLLFFALVPALVPHWERKMSFISRWFSPQRGTAEQQFWQWFATNSVRYKALGADQRELMAELDRELARVQPGLTWEHNVKDGELVISADGNRKLFPAVQKLVAAAPSIPGWRIVAFRQPCHGDLTLSYSNYTVASQDVWFRTEADGTKVGITLFLPHSNGVDKEVITGAAFLLLDAALGEYDVETKVGFVEWLPRPEEPKGRGLLPYKELPAAVNHLYQRLQSN